MIALMTPLSLIDASERATGKTMTEVNSLVRLARTLAEDKLQHSFSEETDVCHIFSCWWDTSSRHGTSMRILLRRH